MDHVVLDLEATCWEKGTSPERMETIEFGAVRLHPESFEVVDEFARFVRPVKEPRLSEFCTQLTSITQAQVDAAAEFPEVFAEFLEWYGDETTQLCTWGDYDGRQLRIDCRRHGLEFPERLAEHLNVKRAFAVSREARPCGMKKALNILGLPMEGTHHRGIDDARNIAKVLAHLMRPSAAQLPDSPRP